ncbi:Vitellin-degrading protease, partial [Blattella germanica]
LYCRWGCWNLNGRIVGGSDASIADYPYQTDLPKHFGDLKQALPLAETSSISGDLAVVTGWGQLSTSSAYSPPGFNKLRLLLLITLSAQLSILQRVALRIIRYAPMHRMAIKIHVKEMQGNPLVVNGKLVGIASWNPNCSPQYPYVPEYTYLTKFREYIKKRIGL